MKPIDQKKQPHVCDCDDLPQHHDREGTHYLRRCARCGYEWFGLHCPHDGYQNPCPKCGKRPETVSERP